MLSFHRWVLLRYRVLAVCVAIACMRLVRLGPQLVFMVPAKSEQLSSVCLRPGDTLSRHRFRDHITSWEHCQAYVLQPQRAKCMGRKKCLSQLALPDAGASFDVWAMLQQLPEQVAAMGMLGLVYYQALFVFMQQLVVFPITPFIMSAAYVFDGPLMYVMATIGIIGSHVVGFFLARSVLQPQIQKMLGENPTFKKISKAVEKDGFKIAMLCRCSLVIPTPYLTYMFGGLTNVSFGDYIAATLLASVPEGWVIVYMTAAARDTIGTLGEGDTPWFFTAMTIMALSVLIHTISDIAKQVLDDSIEDKSMKELGTSISSSP